MHRINYSKTILYALIAGMVLINCNFTDNRTNSNEDTVAYEVKPNNNEIDSEQIIVASCIKKKSYKGVLVGYEYINENWVVTFDSIPCTFGRNGFAEPNQKMEGDGKTPTGTFQIGSAFGYTNDLDAKMNFIELSDNHYWVSDTNSLMYNKLVDYYPKGVYVEKMKRNDHLYKYGIIIEYNTSNTMKGKGSAIFIHVERKEGAPTAGCIAVSNKNMKKLIRWIDPDKKPMITMGHLQNIDAIK